MKSPKLDTQMAAGQFKHATCLAFGFSPLKPGLGDQDSHEGKRGPTDKASVNEKLLDSGKQVLMDKQEDPWVCQALLLWIQEGETQ